MPFLRMILKKHINEKTILVLIDDNLIGKYYEEKELQLDLSSDFYKGEKVGEKDILNEAREADILHIVGINSVEWSIKSKLVDKQNVRKIKNVPFAFVVIES